jgi:hypothetical protein
VGSDKGAVAKEDIPSELLKSIFFMLHGVLDGVVQGGGHTVYHPFWNLMGQKVQKTPHPTKTRY